MNLVVFHLGRCGSKVLAGLLRHHIAWLGEVYDTPLGVDRADPDPALTKIAAPFSGPVGVEIKPWHLTMRNTSLDGALPLLRVRGFNRIVTLARRNHLRKIVSSYVARVRMLYHSTVPLPPVRVELPPYVYIDRRTRSILETIEDDAHDAARLCRVGDLNLVYERDILRDPLVAYQRVCDLLDVVPFESPTIPLARTVPEPLRDVIINFDQVADALRGTSYAWMLDE